MSITRILCALVLTAVWLALPASSSAQQFGIKGGINFASLTPEEDEDPETSRRLGPVGGGWFATPIGTRLSLQIEALFAEKGVTFEANPFGLDYAKIRLRYLEVPVLVRHDFGDPGGAARLFVLGGLAPAFELSARSTASFQGQVQTRDFGDAIKPFDLGLAGGVGVEFGPLVVEGRYTHGLLHINEDDNGDEDRIKNRVFSVMAGVRFR
jgi:hypothetical protein